MDSVSTTRVLTISTIKMFVRNRQALFFTLFMPLMIMVIFGLIGFDKVAKINVGLVDGTPTPATQQFIDQLKKIDIFKISAGTETDLRADMKKGDLAVIMVVPDNFFPTGPVTEPTTLKLLENVSQQQYAKTAESIINQILDKTTLAMTKAPTYFSVATEDVSVRSTKYIDFLLPGIVGMALMQMAVFSVAFVFADYKEKGILKRLLATPMKPRHFVTAQVITRLCVALAQTAILIAVGMGVLHTHVYGNWLLIALISILGCIMFLGLGFTISGMANTVDSVPAIANLIVFPMLFLGGTFFPTDNMPQWLQSVVHYLPLQFLTHSLREVMANGSGLGTVATDLYWMVAWAVILVGLSMFTFRFEEKRV